MKPTLLAISLALTIATSTLSTAFAHSQQGMQRGEQGLFAGLNLSDIQKQDIRQIMRQTKQDNALLKGEKQYIRPQLRALMTMEVWDPSAAEDLVSQGLSQSRSIALNMAIARHQAFNVLDESQQDDFLAMQATRADEKSERDGLNISRLEKRLGLSEQQIIAITQIQAEHQQQSEAIRASLSATKAAEQALVFAPEFDQEAWLALQAGTESERIQLGVARAYTHFQILGTLDESQKASLESMLNKKREKKSSKKGKAKHHQQV